MQAHKQYHHTVTATSPVTGEVIATARITTGSSAGARALPTAFVRKVLAAPSYRLTVDVKRGDQRRTMVKINGTWYTRTF